jgi:hypothetical protein
VQSASQFDFLETIKIETTDEFSFPSVRLLISGNVQRERILFFLQCLNIVIEILQGRRLRLRSGDYCFGTRSQKTSQGVDEDFSGGVACQPLSECGGVERKFISTDISMSKNDLNQFIE